MEVPENNREQPFLAIIQIHNPSRSTSHHCQYVFVLTFLEDIFGREH